MGLYGIHGHLFDKDDCDIADVISAAMDSVGFKNVQIPEKSRLQAIEELKSYPSGYPIGPLP